MTNGAQNLKTENNEKKLKLSFRGQKRPGFRGLKAATEGAVFVEGSKHNCAGGTQHVKPTFDGQDPLNRSTLSIRAL